MMSDLNFPRILIIGAAPINQKSATGITLVNLFSGWPLERIAQIYDDATEPDRLYCNEYRRFSSEDIPLIKAAKRALKKIRHSERHSIQADSDLVTTVLTGPVSYGFFGAYSDIAPFKLTKEIMAWVENYKPEIIYSVLGSVRMINMALQLSNKFSIPIVPHFMDDWPSTAYARNWALYVPRMILNSKLKQLLLRTDVRLTICSDMATEYSARYGGKFDYFMNCVDIHRLHDDRFAKGDKCIRFGFVGGMHLNRWRSLLFVVNALQELKNNGATLSVDIYAPHKDLGLYEKLFREYSVVGTMSTLMADEVDEQLRRLDVLIHIESFLEEDSLYTRYSISTKIPQYMASGRPILAFGPAALSSIRYIKSTGAGLIVDQENDIDSLKRVACALIESSSLRLSLGERGRFVAVENHNAAVERDRFRSVLCLARG